MGSLLIFLLKCSWVGSKTKRANTFRVVSGIQAILLFQMTDRKAQLAKKKVIKGGLTVAVINV